MNNIIIVHGSYGSPQENWFPWLKTKLEKNDCRVFILKFPTPKNQSLHSWLGVFKPYEKYLDKSFMVIGHSLGPAFLLSVLEKRTVKAAFFVAGFAQLLDNPEFDELNRTFVTKKFNWTLIKKNCKKFYVINSDTDPYVPLEKGRNMAKNLDTDLIVLHNAGHINKEAGYTQFDFLLEKIKKEL